MACFHLHMWSEHALGSDSNHTWICSGSSGGRVSSFSSWTCAGVNKSGGLWILIVFTIPKLIDYEHIIITEQLLLWIKPLNGIGSFGLHDLGSESSSHPSTSSPAQMAKHSAFNLDADPFGASTCDVRRAKSSILDGGEQLAISAFCLVWGKKRSNRKRKKSFESLCSYNGHLSLHRVWTCNW